MDQLNHLFSPTVVHLALLSFMLLARAQQAQDDPKVTQIRNEPHLMSTEVIDIKHRPQTELDLLALPLQQAKASTLTCDQSCISHDFNIMAILFC